jgi:hypothetical protein
VEYQSLFYWSPARLVKRVIKDVITLKSSGRRMNLRHIKRSCRAKLGEAIKARGEKGPPRIVGLAQLTGRTRCLEFGQGLFLECNSGRGQGARLRDALQFSGRAIHFYNGGQVGCQEYSELSNSALLALSAPAIGRNRQLGIFRNSEYGYSVNGILSVSCVTPYSQQGGLLAE